MQTNSTYNKNGTKYIFVTGGVVSGLGKGITTSSLGLLLKSKGHKVTAIKIDPYINYDAGTLRPTEHGEVWVTEDGGEIDQDLGHYERFMNQTISKDHNITTGQVYKEVIDKERRGEYLGKTVQPIPHITDEIKRRIKRVSDENDVDFVLIEIGGVVGDYENVLFLEAARQLKMEKNNTMFVHVVYLPLLKSLGEMKTKPTQHSVRALRELGIQPDFIVCRSENELDEPRINKISLFCSIEKDCILSNPDVKNIYEIPMEFKKQNFGNKILKKFGMEEKESDLKDWKKFVDSTNNPKKAIQIGVVGKYVDIGDYKLPDSYVSVLEAIKHASAANNIKSEVNWIDAKDFEKDDKKLDILNEMDGIIVPGGFGSSGVEGKIKAIKFARENNIPYLGLCFGLQLAVIEFARNVCNIEDAHSTEINENTENPVVDFLPWQRKLIEESKYGATMRLGGQTTKIKTNTLARKLYGKKEVTERFRHRYEINPKYIDILEKNGFVFSGEADDKYTKGERVMQIGELPEHPFFIGSQFHPEFTSRPLKPNSLFKGFIKAAASTE